MIGLVPAQLPERSVPAASVPAEAPSGPEPTAAWADAVDALSLLAIDPAGLGGLNLRAAAGPVRDAWLAALREGLAPGTPVRRVPAATSEQRLLGGLDLAATLAAGRPVVERGLLAEADGGVLVLAMAERMPAASASYIAQALDTGVVQIERDGLSAAIPTRVAFVCLDEGIGDEEGTPTKLLDRAAFRLDLSCVAPRDMDAPFADRGALKAARDRLARVEIDDDMLDAISGTALALGVHSMRGALLAVKAARAAAALGGRSQVSADDAALAARLVLGPRATQLPAPPPPDDDADDPPEPEPPEPQPPVAQQPDEQPPETDPADPDEPPAPADDATLEDLLLEAATAAIPAGLLDQLKRAGAALNRAKAQGRSGQERKVVTGGRPVGVRRGDPRRGGRLNVIETLRTAAPWQSLRRRERVANGWPVTDAARIEVRKSDFQISRNKQKSETATIFVVDASGSSALNRLAEAKGAVELLLADCYVRRDQVAVIAFRGLRADVLLPPTRSLVRAKRSLAGLPGGGPTPLASAIDAARELAEGVKRRGQTPTIVFLTDGRGNVARDGRTGRAIGETDATLAARSLRALGMSVLLIDTSPKPQAMAEKLAIDLDALYLPLPYADAARLSAAVRATRPDPS
jgi:magnesium chelatase subunit D